MAALYIVFHSISEYSGITKKIRAQVKAMNTNGLSTRLCWLGWDEEGRQVRWIDDRVAEIFGTGLWGKIKKRVDYSGLLHYIKQEQIALVYMRFYFNANPFLIHFCRQLRELGVKVVMEIPTYPYEQEFKESRWRDWPGHLLNRLFRKSLAQQLEAIITFSNYEQIDGQRTIRISNGIDLDTIPLKGSWRRTPSTFHLIAVAELHFWHGFDRAIEGLRAYYEMENCPVEVVLHIVGKSLDGYDKQLFELVQKYGLEQHVVFHGVLWGEDLDEVFELADMAIASLGRHRSGITNIKTLKNREYAARGIPFVYSEIDDDFEKMPYVFKAFPDESPLPVLQLFDFYRQLDISPAEIRESIENTLSWNYQIKSILKALEMRLSCNSSVFCSNRNQT